MKYVNVKSRKQGGFVLTAELVLIVTILVLGSIVGLVTMRDALTGEMEDVAEAVGALDQGYQFDGLINPQETAATAGSAWTDAADNGDNEVYIFTVASNSELTASTPAIANPPTADGSVSPVQ